MLSVQIRVDTFADNIIPHSFLVVTASVGRMSVALSAE